MNTGSFLKLFVPKDRFYFPIFEKDAKNLVRASELLKELMISSDKEYERIHNEIKDVEHTGDELTDKTFEQLNRSFITPFDRDDIHELTSRIDDIVDTINGIAIRIFLYNPKKLTPVYKEMASLISEASKEIETAIYCLRDTIGNKVKISRACGNVNAIEHKADELYFTGISELFEKEEDTKELIKNTTVLEMLERCVDEEEDVTDIIRTILIKLV